jgi:uncharacterized protein YdgA (DUF945 family)
VLLEQLGLDNEKIKARLLLAGASEQLVVGTISAHSLAGSANLKAKVSAKILETFKPMLQAQIQQGMVIEKNGFYQTSANYQNKKLMVNGKDMSAFVKNSLMCLNPFKLP